MSGLANLKHFLRTDPADAGCEETFALLHLYVERELEHGDATDQHPRVAAHLAFCGPCQEDYRGLLSLLR